MESKLIRKEMREAAKKLKKGQKFKIEKKNNLIASAICLELSKNGKLFARIDTFQNVFIVRII